MTPQQFVERFGGRYRRPAVAARAIGVPRQVVGNWLARGKIPELALLKIKMMRAAAK